MKGRPIFACFILTAFSLSAQNPRADSLKNLLSNAKDDTTKVIWLNQLCFALEPSATEEKIDAARAAFLLAENLQYAKGLASSCAGLAEAFESEGLFVSSNVYLMRAKEKLGKMNNEKGLS